MLWSPTSTAARSCSRCERTTAAGASRCWSTRRRSRPPRSGSISASDQRSFYSGAWSRPRSSSNASWRCWTRSPGAGKEIYSMPPKTILVIDDEADIREVAALTLETMGVFAVTTAPNGEAGIECARCMKPDAILLDVMMPELDGPSTLARLRETGDTRDIPVIFLTAKVQAVDRRRLGALGAAGIIAKP